MILIGFVNLQIKEFFVDKKQNVKIDANVSLLYTQGVMILASVCYFSLSANSSSVVHIQSILLFHAVA